MRIVDLGSQVAGGVIVPCEVVSVRTIRSGGPRGGSQVGLATVTNHGVWATAAAAAMRLAGAVMLHGHLRIPQMSTGGSMP